MRHASKITWQNTFFPKFDVKWNGRHSGEARKHGLPDSELKCFLPADEQHLTFAK